MRALYRQHAFAFIAPVVNFMIMSGRTVAEGGFYLFPLYVLFLPAWITASIAWAEKGESEPLLRSLPVTDRDIAKTKFTLALLAMAGYWVFIAFVAIIVSLGTGHFAANFLFANVVWAVTLLLVAFWYIGIWSGGYSSIAGWLVAFIVVDVAAVLVALIVARLNRALYLDAFSRVWRVPGSALWAVPVVLGAALLAYYGLLRVGARARAKGVF